MVVNERHESDTELLILNAALACLSDETELKGAKAAEIERMGAAIANAIPGRWPEISAALPRLKKRGQNVVALALLARKPPVTDPEIFMRGARQMHQLDHHVRAGLVARLSRLGEATEAGRQLILMLQNCEKESSFRVSMLSKVAASDLGELHRLLVQRASELMLFPRSVLRLSLDWTVRLHGSTVERRALISQMPRLLAKLKWRDIPDALLLQYFTTIADMGEGAGMLHRTLEWGLLFQYVLKQLRTRPTARALLLTLGQLLATSRTELSAQDAPAAPKVNRVTYDPQSGKAWTSVPSYPPPSAAQPAPDGETDEAAGEATAPEAPTRPASVRAAILARLRPRFDPPAEAEAASEAVTEADVELNAEPERETAPEVESGAGSAVSTIEEVVAEAEESEAGAPEPVEEETEEQDEENAVAVERQADLEELEELLENGMKLLMGIKAQSEQRAARLAELRGRIDALRKELSGEQEAHQRDREQVKELEKLLQALRDRLGQEPGDEDDRLSA